MTTNRPSIYDGLTCPTCRRFYKTAKSVRFLARYGLCYRCWHAADPDARRAYDPFAKPTREVDV